MDQALKGAGQFGGTESARGLAPGDAQGTNITKINGTGQSADTRDRLEVDLGHSRRGRWMESFSF